MSDGLFDMPGGGAGTPDFAVPDQAARLGDTRAPLAVRMRPASLDEVVGQQHLLGPGSPLRRLVEGSGAASVLLYGPPGTGKTTLASLISHATGRRFEALSALSAGVKEVRAVIDVARRRLTAGEQTVLFIDEVHRFSKTQQDALLAAVENRIVLLVGGGGGGGGGGAGGGGRGAAGAGAGGGGGGVGGGGVRRTPRPP
ncbi:AAA family ATPase, partial [Nocardia carnea]|uniref:AAA family ATPase n=1 Tax=Nocardia carnea TaxID=37328 RepID=UPI002458C397